jgi:hypothetical protein
MLCKRKKKKKKVIMSGCVPSAKNVRRLMKKLYNSMSMSRKIKNDKMELRDDYGDINADAMLLLQRDFYRDPALKIKINYIVWQQESIAPAQVCVLVCSIILSHLEEMPCEHEMLPLVSILERYDQHMRGNLKYKTAHALVMRDKTQALAAVGACRYMDVSMQHKVEHAIVYGLVEVSQDEVSKEDDP